MCATLGRGAKRSAAAPSHLHQPKTEPPPSVPSRILRSSRMPRLSRLLAALALLPAASWAQPPAPQERPGQPQQAPEGEQKIRTDAEAPVFPLRHTDVRVEISGSIARVLVEQIFQNPYDRPIEAVYVFPLPNRAAVDEMEIRIGDRVVRGEIRKRDEARQIYEQARREGRVAALLDQERPNIFTQQVAHILPGHEIRVRIRYVETLPYENDAYEMVFPTVVGPRFIPGVPLGAPRVEPASAGGAGNHGPGGPGDTGESGTADISLPGGHRQTGSGWAPDTDRVPDASRITPPVVPPGQRSGHDIDIRVDLDAGVPLAAIEVPSHAVDIERQGRNRGRIVLRPTDTLPNKDFVLRYRVAGTVPEFGFLAHRDGDGEPGYFALHLVPELEVSAREARPKEMIFLLDTSGSMRGEPLARSKAAMRWAMQHLGPDDTFQIIRFSEAASSFAAGPVANTPEQVQRGLVYVEQLEGEGGTHMLAGILAALRIPPDPARLRVVCLLTDGYIGNETEILAAVRQELGEARLFSFGIGSSVNHYLLDELALEGRGAVDYIALDGDTRPLVERFYARIARPHLTDLSLDWGDLQVEGMVPERLPDLFAGQTLVVSGRYRAAGRGEILLRGKIGRRHFERRLAVVLPAKESQNGALGTLWARRRIEALTRLMVRGEQEPYVRELTETALAFHLVSRYTSFVAADNQVVSKDGEPMLVPQPVDMPEGVSHEGVFGVQTQGISGMTGAALNTGTVVQSGELHVRGGRSGIVTTRIQPNLPPTVAAPAPTSAPGIGTLASALEKSEESSRVDTVERRLAPGTLEVQMTIDRQRLLVGERGHLRLTVRNRSAAGVQVPEVVTWNDVQVRITHNGKSVTAAPSGHGRGSGSVLLAPGETRTYELVLDEAPGHTFAAAGRFEIEMVEIGSLLLPEPHPRATVRIE